LISLRQAIGLIMGANIGTTVMFWIASYLGCKFIIGSLSLPAIGIGLFLLFFRKLRAAEAGSSLIGFGFLFLGLGLLKDSVPDLRQYPKYFEFVRQWEAGSALRLIVFLER